jgi:hypothetical protein
MSAEWAAHPLQPIQLTSTNQKSLFHSEPVSTVHFTQDIAPTYAFVYINMVPKSDHGSKRVK